MAIHAAGVRHCRRSAPTGQSYYVVAGLSRVCRHASFGHSDADADAGSHDRAPLVGHLVNTLDGLRLQLGPPRGWAPSFIADTATAMHISNVAAQVPEETGSRPQVIVRHLAGCAIARSDTSIRRQDQAAFCVIQVRFCRIMDRAIRKRPNFASQSLSSSANAFNRAKSC